MAAASNSASPLIAPPVIAVVAAAPVHVQVLERPQSDLIDVTAPLALAHELRVNRDDTPPAAGSEDSPWSREPGTVDEMTYTPWAEAGWEAWNDMSPEREFCEWVATLVSLFNPQLIVETGVGQGYTTRRVIGVLQANQQYVGFETSDYWRGRIAQLEWFAGPNTVLANEATPSADLLAQADLVIFDSDYPFRVAELDKWLQVGKPGSMLVLHDAGNGHPAESIHAQLHNVMASLPLEGTFLNNPRGGCFAIKPAGRLVDRGCMNR